jgi:hypothetical protein
MVTLRNLHYYFKKFTCLLICFVFGDVEAGEIIVESSGSRLTFDVEAKDKTQSNFGLLLV